MKNTAKLLLLSLGAVLALAPAARAGDEKPDRPHEERREKMRERMVKELGLTPEQDAKFKDLGQQERSQLEAVRDDASLGQDQKRAKAQEIRKNFESQRRALMTPEQQKKADEMREKMKEHRGERGGPPPEKN